MQTTLPHHDIVLLGIGHTNAHVLRKWKMSPIDNARLTCISNASLATYSGMLPGVLAGQYEPQSMEIDLVRLCAAAGARLIIDDVQEIDADAQRLLFSERAAVRFDVLSIGIGSVPQCTGVEFADDMLLPIKPMQSFLARLNQRLDAITRRNSSGPVHIVVVGGGVGGVEIAMCLPSRLHKMFGDRGFALTLITGAEVIAKGTLPKTERLVRHELERRQVTVLTEKRVKRVDGEGVILDDDRRISADLVLWATSATAPPLLRKLGLPADEQGFLLTESTLKTCSDLPIFAVGDAGTIAKQRTAKAGVYAVRQGPILWENLQRILDQRPLRNYTPQKDFLKLLNCGNGAGIAEYKKFSFHGKWCWRLKDRIDSRFMKMYQDYLRIEMPSMETDPQQPMRCAGCGGKVGGSVLSRVLNRLEIPSNQHVLLGLDQPDDAAVIQPPGGRPITVTADFFAAPLDDPYLVGRISALNSASDVFAVGGKALAALALATIPVGKPRQQEQLLYELLAGSLDEFRKMDATLIGGHTIEGPQTTIGFTVLADQGLKEIRTKGKLVAGDLLVLTKPLGSGVLLAAHMEAQCQADWMGKLVETMLLSNADAASLIDEFDIAALTDVTGFGLAGHCLEMLRASGVAAKISLASIPLLPGVRELCGNGKESTLAPANRVAEEEMKVLGSSYTSAGYRALFDPQTSGGLLLGVSQDKVSDVLRRLEGQSDVPATVIGQVVEKKTPQRFITVVESDDFL